MKHIFYMVYVENENQPKFIHPTYFMAEQEAKRLAKLTGKKAFVLKSITCIQLNEFLVTEMQQNPDEDDLPF